MSAEELYDRALNSLIFLCEMPKGRPEVEQYADAIAAQVKGVTVFKQGNDKAVISLPDDEWVLSADLEHTWLFSKRAQGRIRITGYVPEDVAKVAAQAADIWQYIQSKQQ